MDGTTQAVRSKRQQKIHAKKIRAENANRPKLETARRSSKQKEHYFEPEPADGETIIHEVGKSGRPIAVRLDPLRKLFVDGKITPEQRQAGEAYLGIVQAYFIASSGLSRIETEAPAATSNADPIRLYAKGRRRYVPTQRPKVIHAPRTSSDGWSASRSNAMEALGRVRKALRGVDGDALRALYALVIHPNMPARRPTTLRAYVLAQYGYRNQAKEDAIVALLKRALDSLWKEFGAASSFSKAA